MLFEPDVSTVSTGEIVMAPPPPPPPGSAKPAAPASPSYFISKSGEATWCLTMDIGAIQVSSSEFASIYFWLSSLSDKDTVKVTILDTGSRNTPFVQQLPLLNALMLCSAKTVAVIDRMFMGNDCYFVLACRDTEATEFGLLNIPSVYPQNADRLNEQDEAVMQAANAIIRNGEEIKLIRPEDVETLLSRRAVVITAADLKERMT